MAAEFAGFGGGGKLGKDEGGVAGRAELVPGFGAIAPVSTRSSRTDNVSRASKAGFEALSAANVEKVSVDRVEVSMT